MATGSLSARTAIKVPDNIYITKHIIVTGKVQGVFFRAHTKEKADELNLTGWVRNKANGTVEIIATGDRTSLDTFIRWLHIGSPQSDVSTVIPSDQPLISFDTFNIQTNH